MNLRGDIKMNVTMPEESSAAKNIGEACITAKISEINVTFRNTYDANLVQIWAFGTKEDKHQKQGYGTKAMHFICGKADEFGYDLVLMPSAGNKAVLSKFYPRFGFVYINDGKEMLRKHDQHEKQAIKNTILEKIKKCLWV